MKNKKMIIGILITIAIITIACYIPEVLSSDDVIASEVAEALDNALEQTEAAATYTPYPTYTPNPTYTSQPSMRPFDQPFSAPSAYNIPYNYPYGPRR